MCCSHSPRHTGPPDGFHDNLTTATSSSSMSSVSLLSSLSLELERSLSDTFSESLWSAKKFVFVQKKRHKLSHSSQLIWYFIINRLLPFFILNPKCMYHNDLCQHPPSNKDYKILIMNYKYKGFQSKFEMPKILTWLLG